MEILSNSPKVVFIYMQFADYILFYPTHTAAGVPALNFRLYLGLLPTQL